MRALPLVKPVFRNRRLVDEFTFENKNAVFWRVESLANVQEQPLREPPLISRCVPCRRKLSLLETEKPTTVSMMLLVAVGFVLILLVVFLIVIIAYTQSAVLMVV